MIATSYITQHTIVTIERLPRKIKVSTKQKIRQRITVYHIHRNQPFSIQHILRVCQISSTVNIIFMTIKVSGRTAWGSVLRVPGWRSRQCVPRPCCGVCVCVWGGNIWTGFLYRFLLCFLLQITQLNNNRTFISRLSRC